METASAQPDIDVKPVRPGFLSYLRQKELTVFPTGALRWWLMALIVWAWTIEQFEAQRLAPVLVYVFDEFDISMAQWGVVPAAAGVMYAIGSIVLSRLADRFGRRPLLIWPVVVYLGVVVIGALAPSFEVLAAVTIVGAFTVAGMSPAVHAASRDLTPNMGRAFAYSWVALSYTAGALLSTAIAARTIPLWPGWRPQFWIGAIFALFTAVGLAIFYRDLAPSVRQQLAARPEQPGAPVPQGPSDPKARASYLDGSIVYRSGRLWLLSVTLVFWSLAYGTIAGYVPTYLKQYFQRTPANAAEITSYFWLTFTISILLAGWLSDRMNVRKTLTAFGGVATGLCLFAIARLPADSTTPLLILMWCLTGSVAGFIHPTWAAAFSETAERVSPHGVARAFGMVGALIPATGLILNLGLPRVVETHGWPAWLSVAGAACMCCALLTCFARGPWWLTKTTSTA
jgi:MFS family permease